MRTRELKWVKELLSKLPKEQRKEVLANLESVRKSLKNNHFEHGGVVDLSFAFTWESTHQGFGYWDRLYHLTHGN